MSWLQVVLGSLIIAVVIGLILFGAYAWGYVEGRREGRRRG